jgi:hypothetical protein
MMYFLNKMLAVFGAVLLVAASYAQEGETQMFTVHMDKVHPSKISDYEAAAKGLHGKLVQHNVQDVRYLTLALDDFTYMYVSPIDNFAELDTDPFSVLNEKVGEEEMGKIWSAFSPCYSEHGDFIIYLDPELSYQPGGVNPNPADEYYRTLEYWYVDPVNMSALVEKARKIKAMHEKMGSEFYYRVYRSGYGTMGPYFMVASAAKSPQDWQSKADDSAKKLGDEFRNLIGEAFALTRHYERSHGWIRPDLTYAPK